MNTGEPSICFNCMSLLSGSDICPRCGHDANAAPDPDYKTPGSVLVSRYLVGWLRHKNGESALYKGFDRNSRSPVWIKEYFPTSIATRGNDGSVLPVEGFEAQYKALMSDFVDMCEDIRRMNGQEPTVPLDDVFAQDNTIYAIYRNLPIQPLEDYLAARGGKLPVQDAAELLQPLCNTLSNMHSRGEMHRGISPYTVYIDPEQSKLVLWGFALGATRTGGSELEAELFNGYSAPEQYASNGWQGSWTDVYAVAALFYRMVSGFVPPKSVLVSPERPLAPLFDLVMDISKSLSDAVDHAMIYDAQSRTQSMGAFCASLIENDDGHTSVYDINRINQAERQAGPARQSAARKRKQKNRMGKYVFFGLLLTVLVLVGTAYMLAKTYFPELLPAGPATVDDSSSRSTSSSQPSSQQDGEEDEALVVPAFVGMLREEIEGNSAYSAFRITIEEGEYRDDYAAGIIYEQSVARGATLADPTQVITLYVSKGQLKIVMPNLIDLPIEEAIAAIAALSTEYDTDLRYSSPMERYSADKDEGTVLETTPAPGEEFNPKNTQIAITIAWKPETSDASQQESSSSEGESVAREKPSSSQEEPSQPEAQPSQSSEESRPRRDADGVDL